MLRSLKLAYCSSLLLFVFFHTQLLNTSLEEDQMFGGRMSDGAEMLPPKSDSYINLFDDGQDVPLGGSAHSLRNLLSGSRESRPNSGGSIDERPLAPDALYSPVGHAAANAVSHPEPSAVFQPPSAVLPNDAKYPTAMAGPPPLMRPLPPPSSEADLAAAVQAVVDTAMTGHDDSSTVRRPMSFVRALELSERLTTAENDPSADRRYRKPDPAGNLQQSIILELSNNDYDEVGETGKPGEPSYDISV